MLFNPLTQEEITRLLMLTKHRSALYELRKYANLSRTDMEVMAFVKLKNGIFSTYELKKQYTRTNVQQLLASVRKLEKAGVVELIQKGVKNKTSTYWMTGKGVSLIDDYLALVF